jgi:hypothetical protein
LPILLPGWEDSTRGRVAAHCIGRGFPGRNLHTVRTGIEYMMQLAQWYSATTAGRPGRRFSDRRRDLALFPHLCRAQ